MDWLMVRTSLFEHPKILKLSRILKVRTTEALGLCITLWSKAYGITRTGDTGYAPDDLDQWIGKKGLAKAIIEVGWASISSDNSIVLENWAKYSGQQQERQESARLRQQRYRDNHRNENVTKRNSLHNVTVTNCNASREIMTQGSKEGSKEVRKEENKKDNASALSKKAHTQTVIPSSFNECLHLLPEDLVSASRDLVETWFLHRSAQGWKTSAGLAIKDCVADLRLWLKKESTSLDVEVEKSKKIARPFVPSVSVEVN